jgi:lysozyme
MSKLTEMLRRHEGVETHAYKCTAGKITIGVGRNIDPAGGIGLSDDEIEMMLENDAARCAEELGREFQWFSGLDDVRRDAMIDLCFNIGITSLRNFKMANAAMAEDDYDKAADEYMDSKWASQVGNRAKEICAMIRTGEYQE